MFIPKMCSLKNNLNVLLWEHNKSLKHKIFASRFDYDSIFRHFLCSEKNVSEKNNFFDFFI